MIRRAVRVLFLALLLVTVSDAQTNVRRLTTVDALRQFPGFYHLQNVLVRGELATEGSRMFLRADEHEVRVILDDDINTPNGVVDARGLFLDVGRLEEGDPRAGSFNEGREAGKWPKPGEELIVRISATAETQPVAGASVKSTCQARPARANTTSSFAALKARSGSPTCARRDRDSTSTSIGGSTRIAGSKSPER